MPAVLQATNVVLGLPKPKVLMTMDLCMQVGILNLPWNAHSFHAHLLQVLFTEVELEKLSSSRCNGSVIATHLPRVTRSPSQQ